MIILNPLEPWPGELVLDAAGGRRRERDHARRRLRRPVPRRRAARPRVRRRTTTAGSAPRAGCEAGREKLERMRPYRRAPRPDACCSWRARGTSRSPPVALRRAHADPGGAARGARPIEDKRAELAAARRSAGASSARRSSRRSARSATTAARMALKGASPEHEGAAAARPLGAGRGADRRWPARWGIDPRARPGAATSDDRGGPEHD